MLVSESNATPIKGQPFWCRKGFQGLVLSLGKPFNSLKNKNTNEIRACRSIQNSSPCGLRYAQVAFCGPLSPHLSREKFTQRRQYAQRINISPRNKDTKNSRLRRLKLIYRITKILLTAPLSVQSSSLPTVCAN